jgi:hypothetical protein
VFDKRSIFLLSALKFLEIYNMSFYERFGLSYEDLDDAENDNGGANEASAEVEMQVADTEAGATELEQFGAAVNDVGSDIDELGEIQSGVGEIINSGDVMTDQMARATESRLLRIGNRLQLARPSYPSFESHHSRDTKGRNTMVVYEGIGSMIANAVKDSIAFLARMIRKFVAWIQSFFTNLKGLKKEAERCQTAWEKKSAEFKATNNNVTIRNDKDGKPKAVENKAAVRGFTMYTATGAKTKPAVEEVITARFTAFGETSLKVLTYLDSRETMLETYVTNFDPEGGNQALLGENGGTTLTSGWPLWGTKPQTPETGSIALLHSARLFNGKHVVMITKENEKGHKSVSMKALSPPSPDRDDHTKILVPAFDTAKAEFCDGTKGLVALVTALENSKKTVSNVEKLGVSAVNAMRGFENKMRKQGDSEGATTLAREGIAAIRGAVADYTTVRGAVVSGIMSGVKVGCNLSHQLMREGWEAK